MSTIRVLVVDDHDLFRRGLVEVLSEEEDIEVAGEASDGREAIERAAELSPHVVCMDLNMPGQGGIEATAFLTRHLPNSKVLVLTVSEEPEDLFRALSVGALGYALKNASPSAIVEALRQVHQGWVVVSPAMASRLLADLDRPSRAPATAGTLTAEDRRILIAAARGLTSAEVASDMGLTEQEVKANIRDMVRRLQANRQEEAAAYADRLKFLADEIGSTVETAYRAMRGYLGGPEQRPRDEPTGS